MHSEKGNQMDLPTEVLNNFSPHPKPTPSTKCRNVLIITTVALVVANVIIPSLFVYYIIKSSKNESWKETICNTSDCVQAATSMIKKMNLAADPCQDFHEYACGRFTEETIIPGDKSEIGTYGMIHEKNQLIMKEANASDFIQNCYGLAFTNPSLVASNDMLDILTEEMKPEELAYIQTMKQFYTSCMDEDQIEKNGLKAYKRDTKFVKDWPTLNPDWNITNFNLNDVMARYAEVYYPVLFESYVFLDMNNSSQKLIYLSDYTLGLSQIYYSQSRSSLVLVAYWTYLTKMAMVLGASQSTAKQDASDVINLEVALNKIKVSVESRQNISKMNNPMTLSQLSSKYPHIDIPRALRAAFRTANVTLLDNERVINMCPDYFGNLSLVLKNFSGRVIQNLFGFKYAVTKVGGLTKQMREIKLELEKVEIGKKKERERWETCLTLTSAYLWKGMSKQFVTRAFPEQAKIYMDEMVNNLKTAFRSILDESTWMGQITKKEAYKKLTAMKQKIGYPNSGFTDEDINQEYKNYIMLENDFYANLGLMGKLSNMKELASLRKPINKDEWLLPPHSVNAYYSILENEIAFLAGVLQPPAFSINFPDAINYGAIGMVIGHEITHGFDIRGSQFNEKGNHVNWWQRSDYEVYLERTQCFIDQYSGFHLSSINMSVNGKLTQGENVADNGGLKQSFRAYKTLVHKNGEQPSLPDLGLTQDQVFFLAFGQMWCDKMTNESLINSVRTNVHPPSKYRIIGTLKNSEDFAKAYNCPLGSYMNPDTKCSVW